EKPYDVTQTLKNSDDEGNDDASLGMNVGGEEGQDTEDDDEEFPDTGIDSLFESTPRVDVQASTTVAPLTLIAPTLPPPTIPTISQEQVKEQVRVQVSKILPKIEKTVNEQLEAEVLTQLSNSSKTSYVVAADLSEKELNKILIEKMESNKSIHRSDEQRNLCKALLDAYECDKIILDTYGDTVRLKRRRYDADKDEEPSIGSDRGSKRRREGKEPESTSALKIIAITELQIVEWHNYKHLDWITVRRDDDKLYKSKKGDFKRLHIQDIEDMLLFLVQGKLKNLTVKERFAFNVSLRMFTRSIVIQRHMKDLQLGVESYQKKLNLTKPDTYQSDLKRKEAYTSYSNPRGFIYQNKDKQNRLMRIDELHKFNDGTLNDVQTALDDRLKAKDEEDHGKSGKVCWWEIIRGRLQDATTDHMIYHMMSLSYKGHSRRH
nr:hypothetical protein [Tanacetum cinerariifolium]